MKPSTPSSESSSVEAILPLTVAAAWGVVVALLFPSNASAQRAPAGDPPPEASAAWLERVGAELRAAELRFTEIEGEPGTWSAPNRAQELRSRVSEVGLEVFSRETGASGEGAPWKLELATTAFGRVGDTRELACRGISVADARAELDHGMLVEWFENSERDLEQGWMIARRPAGIDALEIALEVSGLALRLDEDGRSGVFVDGAGEPRVAYRDLRAWDATGRELSARLEPAPTGVVIRLDDARAVYPITVDPLLTNPAWTAEANQTGADFGWSASTAGDVNGDGYSDVIVGATLFDNGQADEGRAFVFHGSASGLATSPAWTGESNQTGADFGFSVSTAGDVNGDGYSDVIVGALLYDNGQTDEGRAFVFHGSASGLATSPAWTVESDQATAWFGRSVSTAGDVNGDGYSDVLVGANLYDNGETNEGRAFVYHGSPSGLATSPAWTAESDQAGGDFGNAVSTAGDVNGDGYSDVIVGATFYDNGETNEGRAFVYHGSASGLAPGPAWTAESNQAGAQFCRSVSTAGDVNGDGYSDVIVGANLYDNGQTDEGRAFVYHGSASGLATSAAWTAESNQAGANFGISVSSAGDVNGDGYSDLIVGADMYDAGQTDEGRAFVYLGSASGLATSPAWTAESDQVGAGFGRSVPTAGDVNGDGYSDVIVGAYLYDNGQTDEGRAFVYHGSASGLATSPAWTAGLSQAGAESGISVSHAGDVNGDGYSDVIVGADRYDNGQTDEGVAIVYLGSATGLATSPAWAAESNQGDARFGFSVSTAGDVNGDGYSDVIVGAYLYDNGQTDEGRAYVYHGSASGLATSPAWRTESDQAGASFGASVSAAGDVNGDGFSDVIIGARQYDNSFTDDGRAFVYHGSSSGLAASPAWTAQDQALSWFGYSVSTAGDVNGDGYSDVIVGSGYYTNGETDEGRAYVYHGSASGLATSPAWTVESNQAYAAFGQSVSTAGDVNGDGYSDVIVGAREYDNGQTDEGRAFVYHGSSSGLATSPAWTAESDQTDVRFGSVSTAGDVNGDGYSDVIVGAPRYGLGLQGRAYVYHGSTSGLASGPAWTAESNQTFTVFGGSVSTAGDVNGDGYSDVIVGAPLYLGTGSAFVYHGNGGNGGLVRVLQQRDGNNSRPISLLGRTAPNGLFHLRAEFPKNLARFTWATGASPSAWLEWEVKPLGFAFDGTAIEQGTPQSLVPAGGTLIFDELVLAAEGLPHVRFSGPVALHWRARVATNNPLFPNTAWFSAPGNNVTETKLRRPGLSFP